MLTLACMWAFFLTPWCLCVFVFGVVARETLGIELCFQSPFGGCFELGP
jgi:hypothetical protein